MPFNLETIPLRVGLIGMGAMLACTLAFAYSLLSAKKYPLKKELIIVEKNKNTTLFESVIVGVFIFLSEVVLELLEVGSCITNNYVKKLKIKYEKLRRLFQKSKKGATECVFLIFFIYKLCFFN